MGTDGQNPQNKKENFWMSLVHGSMILLYLERFTSYIYALLKNGLFGYLFSGYRHGMTSRLAERASRSKMAIHFAEFRYGICRRIESSVLVYGISWLVRFLRGCTLKVYGAFLASFGIYTAVVTAVEAVLANDLQNLMQYDHLLAAVVLIAGSVPLLLSKKTLAGALTSSVTGHLLCRMTGFTEEDVCQTAGDGGHANIAFMLGIICGVLTYSVPPQWILLGAAGLVWAFLVLIRPEIGVLTLFFAMPFLPTMALAGVVMYTTLSYLLKLFRGKRIFRMEPVDVLAMVFLLLLFFGGTVSFSSASLKPALLLMCLGFGYFLTVELITTREWVVRCSVSAVLAATLVSLYGIVLYFLGGGYSSDAWLDSEMFGAISRRAVATLENPNMLGEYLALLIPVGVSMLVGRGEGMRRGQAFVCLGVMGVCLILTWSRGAWLGLLFAAVLFLFMWHHRAVWVVLGGLAALPFLPMILPASIVNRFASIGNMADSSTSYRVHIWRAAVKMLEDFWVSGIGIGEGAWQRLYPLYTYQGVETAPHAHNLFLQIWLELGIVGLAVFLVFLFLLYQSGFTLFAQLSRGELKYPDLSPAALQKHRESGEETGAREDMQRAKIQLRLAAAGPLCGIFAVLVQGMTDYAWYNYRLYLMFWLVCGLAAAYIREGRSHIGSMSEIYEPESTRCVLDVPVALHRHKKHGGRSGENKGDQS